MRRPLLALAGAIGLAATLSVAPAAFGDTIDPTAPQGDWRHGPLSDGCGDRPPIAPGESATVTIESGGLDRTAVVSVPENYRSHNPQPVILAFHGRGSTGDEIREFSGIDRLPAIGVFPDGVPTGGKQSWQGAPYAAEGVDDVQFTDDLLDALEADYCVDANRVFATGKSNGGGFAALLACRAADRIAAFAPVAGAYYPTTDEGCQDASAPILEFHGLADNTIEYEGGVSHGVAFPGVPDWLAMWAGRNGCERSATTEPTEDTVRTVWRGCDGGDDLEHVAVVGGGHTWPGALAKSGGGYTTQTISATELMWRFFRTHPLTR